MKEKRKSKSEIPAAFKRFYVTMLSKLLARLSQPKPEPLPEADSKLALAVLLVRVGRSDDEFIDAEKDRIDEILAVRYHLTPGQATSLRCEAEELESEVADSVRFTRALKQAVPLEERFGLLEALWEVALADDHRDYTEDGFMRLVCRLLGLNDKDSAFARQRVIQRL